VVVLLALELVALKVGLTPSMAVLVVRVLLQGFWGRLVALEFSMLQVGAELVAG
jgi:short subunit fatty acids transporter